MFNHDDKMPVLLIDGPKIEQVFNNILSNAIEYSPEGSTVLISCISENGNQVVSVKDEGPGIPDKDIDKIFKPFGKSGAKKIGGGKSVGLGLLISRKIIDAHGGNIKVDSKEGSGSTFSFTLPTEKIPGEES